MGAVARRAAWALALLLLWGSLPATAHDEILQCDAGNCDATGGAMEGDCGSTAGSACTVDDADRVPCGVPDNVEPPPVGDPGVEPPIVIEPPGDVVIIGDPGEGMYAPWTFEPPEDPTGIPLIDNAVRSAWGTAQDHLPPQPSLPTPPAVPPAPAPPGDVPPPSAPSVNDTSTCPDYHEACVNLAGPGCWVGTLQPIEGPDVDPDAVINDLTPEACEVHPTLCVGVRAREPVDLSDTADFYAMDLPAGEHRFAMGQASAPWDYTLCVYDPTGQLHEEPVPNTFPPELEGVPDDPSQIPLILPPDPPSLEAAAGSHEVVEVSSADPGTWYVGVVTETCQDTLPGGNEAQSFVGATRKVVQDKVESIDLATPTGAAAILEKVPGVGVPTAKACAPTCALYLIQSYCFGYKFLGSAS